jgi:hypothetical protein
MAGLPFLVVTCVCVQLEEVAFSRQLKKVVAVASLYE